MKNKTSFFVITLIFMGFTAFLLLVVFGFLFTPNTPSKTFTISFNDNGGTLINAHDIYDIHANDIILEVIDHRDILGNKIGYHLDGWLLNSALGSRVSENTLMPAEDIILYANWKPDVILEENIASITININGMDATDFTNFKTFINTDIPSKIRKNIDFEKSIFDQSSNIISIVFFPQFINTPTVYIVGNFINLLNNNLQINYDIQGGPVPQLDEILTEDIVKNITITKISIPHDDVYVTLETLVGLELLGLDIANDGDIITIRVPTSLTDKSDRENFIKDYLISALKNVDETYFQEDGLYEIVITYTDLAAAVNISLRTDDFTILSLPDELTGLDLPRVLTLPRKDRTDYLFLFLVENTNATDTIEFTVDPVNIGKARFLVTIEANQINITFINEIQFVFVNQTIVFDIDLISYVITLDLTIPLSIPRPMVHEDYIISLFLENLTQHATAYGVSRDDLISWFSIQINQDTNTIVITNHTTSLPIISYSK